MEGMKMCKILKISVYKKAFDVMHTGEKGQEFRKPTKWIKQRLFNKDGTLKHYDYIQIVNGYGGHRPQFTAKYGGFIVRERKSVRKYSNGITVEVLAGHIDIKLSTIISKENINNYKIKF